ncbi:MAG: lipid-A-disaccharide synthase [Flavobacteriales bacterium]|nr:lipid-A-disaccharide synthase [Flavobacteriales bacterium]
MKYYIIAGEASGDLHASNLINSIKKLDNNSTFRGFGGDRMEEEGLELVKHYKDLSFMGFWEVLKNLFIVLNNLSFVKSDILNFKPNVLILVDYPGFNMRIAKFAKKRGIKVVYYITPQVWAWKKNRVLDLKQNTDLLLSILPFEVDFFKKLNVQTNFYGHPLLDELNSLNSKSLGLEKPIIALLPGSRKQEIKKMLPIMLEVVDHFTDYQFVIAGAPSIPNSFYRSIINDAYIPISSNKTYEVLKDSKVAVITSGTATLEAAILNIPQVVCYKTSNFSYYLARFFVKIPYISLVNIILNKNVVKELIQFDFKKENLIFEINKLLNKKHKQVLLEEYMQLQKKLGEPSASMRYAKKILSIL